MMNKVLMSALLVTGMASSMMASAEMKGNVEAGKEKSQACAGCHGADGNSAVGNFPKIAGQGEKYLIKQITEIQSGLRPVAVMNSVVEGLSEQDIKDLAAYYASQTMSVAQAKKEGIEEGESLYRAGNPATKVAACIACHGPTGAGVDLAGFPQLGGQHAEYTAAQLKAFRKGERVNDGDSRMMRSIAARLSDREIDALANYISGLHK